MATAQTDGRFICQSHMPLVRDIAEQYEAEWLVTCLYRQQLFPFPVRRNVLTASLQRGTARSCRLVTDFRICKYVLSPFLARVISSTLKMEETRSSETSVYNKSTRRHISQDEILVFMIV
jgi:hypothetical protein